MPKISIVTSSFNQAQFLEECLRSVKEQNYPDIEHIVIDGGSRDGSVELLKDCGSRPGWEHLSWISEPDRGQSDALNKGFLRAKGDIVGWLNSDDFYVKDCFENVAGAFQSNRHLDVLYGDFLWINEITGTYQIRREIPFSPFVLFHNHMPFILSSGAFFVSRKVIDAGHLLDASFHNAMDYEYCLRLYRTGYKFLHLPKVLGALRLHGACKSETHLDRAYEELERARRENLKALGRLNPGPTLEYRLAMLRALANARRWTGKAIRGYYFTQFRPKWLRKIQSDPRGIKTVLDARQTL